VSSPGHRDSCATSIEQHNGNIRQPAINSPQILNSADWRPITRSDHTPPDLLTSDLSLSPRHNKPAFASINAQPPNNPAHINPRRSNTQSASPMNNHPMAISTSMAYGYHPMLATHNSSVSPPTVHSRRPTLASENSLPSLSIPQRPTRHLCPVESQIENFRLPFLPDRIASLRACRP
jgi:hypothetical protein